VAPSCPAGEDGIRDIAEKAMRKALSSSAAWKMERTLPGTEKVFVSSGTVSCHVGAEGIEWRTLEPFSALVAMKKDAMVFEDEDGRREKSASDMPRYSDIRKATDAFAKGEKTAFDDVFEVKVEALGEGRWKAVFVPRNSMLRGLVESLSVEGKDLPEKAELKSGNGAVSRIAFEERGGDAK